MKHGITPAMLRRAVRRAVAEGVRDSADWEARYNALDELAVRERARHEEAQRRMREGLVAVTGHRDRAETQFFAVVAQRDEARKERDEARAELATAEATLLKIAKQQRGGES